MTDKLKALVAKAIHEANDSCPNDDSWADMRKAGYECGCFEMADAVAALLAEQAPAGEFDARACDGIDGKRWEHIANEVIDGGTYRRHMIPESRRELKERIVDSLVRAYAAGRSSKPAEPRDPAAK